MFDGCTGCVLAVSGGSDSMAMLDFFCSNSGLFPFKVAAAHVHHGLRPESDSEMLMVRRYCEQRNIPCRTIKLDIPATKPDGISVETFARQKRYEFFEEVRTEYGYSHIATAHNQDDSIETLLMHIIRGSGSDGARGIPHIRNGQVVRPMINASKSEIDEHCRINNIPFAVDRTNFENTYTRNIYRNIIIPELKKINPSFSASAYGFIEKNLKDSEYIDIQAQTAYESAADEENLSLDIKKISAEHEAILSRCVRRLYSAASNKTLSSACTEAVCRLIRGENTCAEIYLPDGIKAVREYNTLKLINKEADEPFPLKPVIGKNTYAGAVITAEYVESGADISCEDFDRIILRPYRDGDSICIRRSAGTKKLGKLFRDAKIPPGERKRIPTGEIDGHIAFVYGFGTDVNFRPVKGGIKFTLKK